MREVDELDEKLFRVSDVEMETVREPLLDSAEADYLARVDRMDAQDTRTKKLRESSRRLEARREAITKRELEIQQRHLEDFDARGPSLGEIEDLTLEQRTALAMELSLGETSALTTGEIMLKLGRSVGENAAAAGALIALGYVLPEKANKYVNIVMDGAAVAALVSGVDPAFAAIQGTMELVKELNTQSKRLKYNVQSDRMHGRHFGYVRDGAHWYPAFVKQHEKWHGGFGERGNDVDLVYGEHMTFVTLPNNKVEPHFENPIGVRHVEASDGDMLRSFGDVSKVDGLRDWYLLQPDEMETVKRLGQNIPIPKKGFVVHDDDWSVYNVAQDARRGAVPAGVVGVQPRPAAQPRLHQALAGRVPHRGPQGHAARHGPGPEHGSGSRRGVPVAARHGPQAGLAGGRKLRHQGALGQHQGTAHQQLRPEDNAAAADCGAAEGSVRGSKGSGLRGGEVRNGGSAHDARGGRDRRYSDDGESK